MAEGGAAVNRKVNPSSAAKINLVCRYFIHGVCSKGADCMYLHDKSKGLPTDNICKYYQYGLCSYGEKCRYDHVKKDGTKYSSPSTQTRQTAGTTKGSTPTTSKAGFDRKERQSQMVTLGKGGIDHSLKEAEKKKKREEKWAQAKAFVPGQKFHGPAQPGSYAAATSTSLPSETTNPPGNLPSYPNDFESPWGARGAESCVYNSEPTGIGGLPLSAITEDTPLCPYYAQGFCPYEDQCTYAHGDLCDLCGMPRLHPVNRREREAHKKECMLQHEKEMEKAFAIQASEGQECGICLENVLNKKRGPGSTSADRRFGILENCNHCFCLTCIRQWRGNQDEEVSIETHRACPICRTHSDFITPSKYWVTTSEEKTRLIKEYKNALAMKPCKYFKKGKGECPFDRKCFYMHALEDGTVVEENQVKRGWRWGADGTMLRPGEEDYSLWDFISNRDEAGVDSDELTEILLEIFQISDEESEGYSTDEN